MNTSLSQNFDPTLLNEFRVTADRICAITEKHGLGTKGYHSPALPHFTALGAGERRLVVDCLKTYLHSVELAEASGANARLPSTAIWAALSALGLAPPSRLFNRIVSNSIVEIYDLSGLQIWRNFDFLRYCSYTLEEIYCIAWFNRYKRDPAITELCLSKVQHVMSGESTDTVMYGVPEHTLEETCSSQKLTLLASHDLICALRNREGAPAAFLVTSTVRTVSRPVQPAARTLRLVPPAPPAGEEIAPNDLA